LGDEKQLDIHKKLVAFFRAEIETEEQWGFPRLHRIPESFLQDRLQHYRQLSEAEQDRYKDFAATFAAACHTFVVNAPDIDHRSHPYFHKAGAFKKTLLDDPNFRNVPLFRAMIQQYKMDMRRGVPSSVSEAQFALASSIRPVKLPERRRRVRAVLKQLGLVKVDDLGFYRCHLAGTDFAVHVDFGGRSAQLRYVVSFPEFKDRHPLTQFGFERALGFGWGHWDFIVEENVDDVFRLFSEVIEYSIELPGRIRKAARE
jgi:hypothetical protein